MDIPSIQDYPGQQPSTLTVDDSTTVDYPTRCKLCDRPIHWLARFPGQRCFDCRVSNDPRGSKP